MARVQLIQPPLEALKRKLLRARSRLGVIRAILSEYRERLLVDMANWQPGAPRRWHHFPSETVRSVKTLRDELREVWSPGTSKARRQVILEMWLSERPDLRGGFRELVKQADLRRQLVLGVLAERPRLAICANSACLRPYFLRRRRTQIFCSAACAKPRQREHKRRSWAKHGKQWRRRRARRGRTI